MIYCYKFHNANLEKINQKTYKTLLIYLEKTMEDNQKKID